MAEYKYADPATPHSITAACPPFHMCIAQVPADCYSRNRAYTMNIVVVGTDHDSQIDDPGLETLTLRLLEAHGIALIAEENRLFRNTVGKRLADSRGLPWIQIDMSTEERLEAGIYHKLANRMQIRGYDADGNPIMAIRYAENEDGIREEWWLNKIEGAIKSGTVLVICGCLHCGPLSVKAENRGHKVVARVFYPRSLCSLEPELY